MVATVPPRAAEQPPDGGAVRCSLHPDRPVVWISPAGYGACQECKDIVDDLYSSEGLQPVDLDKLMTGVRPDEDWMVEPILPAGKLCGIVSKRGEGKSILMLNVAAAKATGQPILSQLAGPPLHVVYIDMEMGPDDLYQRLESLGYMPDHPQFRMLTEHLHYYQLIALPPLNTEEGGIALEEIVERHQAQLVVIDTVSRVVTGDENTAEPYRDLFRHTETRLKRRRVTLARLDHLGKDTGRGSRGSSAKEDPLDVVWQLEETIVADTLSLTLTKGRQPWIPRHVTIYREDHGEITTHVLHDDTAPEWLIELAGLVDTLGLANKATVSETQTALKVAGRAKSRKIVSQVARFRKGRDLVPKRPEPSVGNRGRNRENQTQETLINIEKSARNHSGNRSEPSMGTVPTLEVGTVPDPGSDELLDLADFADFDPADLPDPFEED